MKTRAILWHSMYRERGNKIPRFGPIREAVKGSRPGEYKTLQCLIDLSVLERHSNVGAKGDMVFEYSNPQYFNLDVYPVDSIFDKNGNERFIKPTIDLSKEALEEIIRNRLHFCITLSYNGN